LYLASISTAVDQRAVLACGGKAAGLLTSLGLQQAAAAYAPPATIGSEFSGRRTRYGGYLRRSLLKWYIATIFVDLEVT
jgi:hypothetical protein